MKSRDKLFFAIGSVAIIAATGIGGYAIFNKYIGVQNTTTTVVTPSVNTANSSTTNTSYKDGTYSASASYSVPHGGQNSINLSVTVTGGNITSVTPKDSYSDSESAYYIDSFESSLASIIVGQSIGSTNYSRIGGASLTTDAFLQALGSIQIAAKA